MYCCSGCKEVGFKTKRVHPFTNIFQLEVSSLGSYILILTSSLVSFVHLSDSGLEEARLFVHLFKSFPQTCIVQVRLWKQDIHSTPYRQKKSPSNERIILVHMHRSCENLIILCRNIENSKRFPNFHAPLYSHSHYSARVSCRKPTLQEPNASSAAVEIDEHPGPNLSAILSSERFRENSVIIIHKWCEPKATEISVLNLTRSAQVRLYLADWARAHKRVSFFCLL